MEVKLIEFPSLGIFQNVARNGVLLVISRSSDSNQSARVHLNVRLDSVTCLTLHGPEQGNAVMVLCWRPCPPWDFLKVSSRRKDDPWGVATQHADIMRWVTSCSEEETRHRKLRSPIACRTSYAWHCKMWLQFKHGMEVACHKRKESSETIIAA